MRGAAEPTSQMRLEGESVATIFFAIATTSCLIKSANAMRVCGSWRTLRRSDVRDGIWFGTAALLSLLA